MAEITLSPQLAKSDYRFIKLGWSGKWLKFPIEPGWNIFDLEELRIHLEKKAAQWDADKAAGKHEALRLEGKYVPERPVFRGRLNNYAFDDPEFIDWLKRGNNYGVTGAGGLIKLESDDIPRWQELGVLDILPETFTVKSSSPTRQHFYFDFDGEIADAPLKDPETGEDIGHIRATGEAGGRGGQVVGPGSLHPLKVRYEVIRDLPIGRITRETLDKVIAKFGGVKTARATKHKTAPADLKDPFTDVTISQVLGAHYHDFHLEGSQMAGPNPYGSHTNREGRCLVIEPGDKSFYCFECEQGGGVSRLIAIRAGIMHCDDPGSPTGRAWWDTIRYALKEGLIDEETANAAGLSQTEPPGIITDMPKWLTEHGLPWKRTKGGEATGSTIYVLEECPGCHDRKGSCEVEKFAGDRAGQHAHCCHETCPVKGWPAFRRIVDPEYYKQRAQSKQERDQTRQTELTIDNLCTFEEKGRGDNIEIVPKFSPDKAAGSIAAKFHVATTEHDEIWVYRDGIYSTTNWQRVVDLVNNIAGDLFPFKDRKELEFKISSKTRTREDLFDKNPYLLCCKNVTVDLKTGEILKHSPDHHLTDQIDVVYDPAAKCPRFLQFLEDVAPNPTDRLMLIDWYAIHAIREMFPYVLFLNGLGRNGKGIYERVLKRFFGESAFSGMPLEELNSKTNRFAGADLAGKRGQIVSEAGESHAKGKRTIPTAFLKNATGDGIIDSDQKNKGRIKFKPFYKATVDSNDMPRIEDSSKGWVERFLKADLPYSFVDNPDTGENSLECKKDPHLFDKLTTPAELSGILNLILSRTPEIIKTGAITKRSGAEMFAEYQKQSDSVKTFLEDFCEYTFGGSEKTYLDGVFKKYEEWCIKHVADKVDIKRFGGAVKKFCNGTNPNRPWVNGKRRKVYPGFSFDANRYQSQQDHCKTINGPLKQVTVPLGPLNHENLWLEIKEKNGGISRTNENEMKNPPIFQSMGLLSNSKNTIGTDSDANGPEHITNGHDSDSTNNREMEGLPDPGCFGSTENDSQPAIDKIDRPTPVKCAKCGEDLTGRGTVEKGGKFYCPKPGCGYPAREAGQ